ncbi:MAG: hypothetical protein IPJ81_10555 [Chitinophagaceae bacterium]|jgi:hypothetical protein|nr:hypothetical protein [Chitinophagaceae bacterium]
MKILFMSIAVFITASTLAQTTNIFVAFAKIRVDKKCVTPTCLPEFKIVSGSTSGTKLGREAKEALQEKYGEQ